MERWREVGRAAFASSATPCFYRDDGWLAWRLRARTMGHAVTGRVGPAAVEGFVELFAAVGASVDALDSVGDFRHMAPDDMSPATLATLLAEAKAAWPRLAPSLRRQAYVLSNDWLAPFLLGVNPILGADEVQVGIYSDLSQALAWLDIEPDGIAALNGLCLGQFGASAARSTLPGRDAALNRPTSIERLLMRNPDLDVEQLATRLGRSVRSLHRDLARSGTTLREIRGRMRELSAQRHRR